MQTTTADQNGELDWTELYLNKSRYTHLDLIRNVFVTFKLWPKYYVFQKRLRDKQVILNR